MKLKYKNFVIVVGRYLQNFRLSNKTKSAKHTISKCMCIYLAGLTVIGGLIPKATHKLFLIGLISVTG